MCVLYVHKYTGWKVLVQKVTYACVYIIFLNWENNKKGGKKKEQVDISWTFEC